MPVRVQLLRNDILFLQYAGWYNELLTTRSGNQKRCISCPRRRLLIIAPKLVDVVTCSEGRPQLSPYSYPLHSRALQQICCPAPSPNADKKRRGRPRSSSSRIKGSHDREAEARRRARAMAAGAALSSKRVAMDPVQELLEEEVRGPSSGAGVLAEAVAAVVNGDGDGAS